jgi:hypothetical protein
VLRVLFVACTVLYSIHSADVTMLHKTPGPSKTQITVRLTPYLPSSFRKRFAVYRTRTAKWMSLTTLDANQREAELGVLQSTAVHDFD